jgi:hypothetical protein
MPPSIELSKPRLRRKPMPKLPELLLPKPMLRLQLTESWLMSLETKSTRTPPELLLRTRQDRRALTSSLRRLRTDSTRPRKIRREIRPSKRLKLRPEPRKPTPMTWLPILLRSLRPQPKELPTRPRYSRELLFMRNRLS